MVADGAPCLGREVGQRMRPLEREHMAAAQAGRSMSRTDIVTLFDDTLAGLDIPGPWRFRRGSQPAKCCERSLATIRHSAAYSHRALIFRGVSIRTLSPRLHAIGLCCGPLQTAKAAETTRFTYRLRGLTDSDGKANISTAVCPN
jgi:hypothetical protein